MSQTPPAKEIRHRILQALHRAAHSDIVASLDRDQLARRLELPWSELSSEIEILEARGELEARRRSVGTRAFVRYTITPAGVAALDNDLPAEQRAASPSRRLEDTG